jgi:hypothetical protein
MGFPVNKFRAKLNQLCAIFVVLAHHQEASNGENMSFALTPSSPEHRLAAALIEFDCSASAFSKISDLPGTAVGQALTGHTAFSNERGTHAMTVVSELRELVASTGGVPVNFSNPTTIRKLLDERRRLRRGVVPQPTSFNVRVNSAWFVEKTKYTGLVTTLFTSMSPRVTRDVADAVANELLRLGYEDVSIHPTPGYGGASFERLFGLEEKPVDPATVSAEYEAQ